MKPLLRALLSSLLFVAMMPPISVGSEADNAVGSARPPAAPSPRTAPRSAVSTTSVIISYSDADKSKALDAARGLGATVKRTARHGDFAEVRVPRGVDPDAFVERLSKERGVKSAEPNGLVHATTTSSNDPGFANQWGTRRINAPLAWDLSQGFGVTVAVIDTGVDLAHPDLVGRVDTENDWDFVNSSDTARDDDGHGTHVAGIIAATLNNRLGVAGVAPGARVLPLKALDANGEGDFFTVAQAIYYAAENASVINMSLGSDEYSSVINNAIQYAISHDVVVIAASGNDSSSIVSYPARFAGVVGVGSTNDGDARSSFSNYGPEVDVTAPGYAIYSTVPGGYAWLSGTSMAAPQVAGTVALIRAAHPELNRQAVEMLLYDSAKDLGALGKDNFYGYGRIDAAAALGGLVPKPISGEIEDIPGAALPASPIMDSVDHTTERVDVYRVNLESGRRLLAELSAVSAQDLNLYLFGPGTTSVYGRVPLDSSVGGSSSETLNHLVTKTGTYYLVVCAHRGGGDYDLSYSTPWNALDDDIPGVGLATESLTDTLTGGTNGWDSHDVFSIALTQGQWIYLSAKSSASDVDLYLWRPGTQSVRSGTASDLAASSVTQVATERILFQASESGTYYVDAYGRSGSGSYELSYGLPTEEATISIAASATIPYGQTGSVVGTLTAASGEMRRAATVDLYRASPGSAAWQFVTSSVTDSMGRYIFAVAPTSKTRYSVRFAGDTSLLSAESAAATVAPQVYVRTPIAPSTMSRSRYYTVYGSLKPRHAKGSYPVRIYRWRRVNGAWKSYGYVKAIASNYGTYTKYSARVRLSTAGKWRLRAIAPEDAAHARSYSTGYDYVTVR